MSSENQNPSTPPPPPPPSAAIARGAVQAGELRLETGVAPDVLCQRLVRSLMDSGAPRVALLITGGDVAGVLCKFSDAAGTCELAGVPCYLLTPGRLPTE